MKLTLENENGVYSAQEGKDEATLAEVLELVERLLIVAGYSVKAGTLDVKESLDE